MPRARKRPTLAVKLSAKQQADHVDRIKDIAERGAAARARLAEATGRPEGRADMARLVARADPLDRQIAKAEANAAHLADMGNRIEAARAERTAASLKRRKATRDRMVGMASEREASRRARLDRFKVLVARSSVLTDWHYGIADRWLDAIDRAADGELARAAVPEADAAGEAEPGTRDAVTGRRIKPDVDGPAIFVTGPSVLGRWSTAVPVAAVESGRRKVPLTFDPKRRKAPRGTPGDGPVSSLQSRALERRDRADELTGLFVAGVSGTGHPDWCAAVSIRVILCNETLWSTFRTLGLPWNADNSERAQCAMAAGLMAVSRAVSNAQGA